MDFLPMCVLCSKTEDPPGGTNRANEGMRIFLSRAVINTDQTTTPHLAALYTVEGLERSS